VVVICRWQLPSNDIDCDSACCIGRAASCGTSRERERECVCTRAHACMGSCVQCVCVCVCLPVCVYLCEKVGVGVGLRQQTEEQNWLLQYHGKRVPLNSTVVSARDKRMHALCALLHRTSADQPWWPPNFTCARGCYCFVRVPPFEWRLTCRIHVSACRTAVSGYLTASLRL